MSIKTDAITAILAHINTDGLADAVTIDAVPVAAVKTRLTGEELAGFDGLDEEAVALHLDADVLSAVPVPGQVIDLDGEDWTVIRPEHNGRLLKLILRRYLS